jgi:hypothetical protein
VNARAGITRAILLLGCLLVSSVAFAKSDEAPECLSCESLIAGLEAEPLPPGDVRNLFVLNQTCIARTSCAIRQEFEHPEWLEAVLTKFVGRFLKRQGEWPVVLEGCKAYLILGELFCADDMARQHIRVDLRVTLALEGCGSENDWRLVERIIRECLLEVGGWVNSLGWLMVPVYRDQVRVDCLRDRAQAGLGLYTNAPVGP